MDLLVVFGYVGMPTKFMEFVGGKYLIHGATMDGFRIL